MTIRPLSGYMLVEPIPQDPLSSGGIMIPETSRQDMKSQFKVVAVGKGKIVKLKQGTFLRLAPEVKVGQTIFANTYAGKEIGCDGKIMRVMEQSSVLGFLEECEASAAG